MVDSSGQSSAASPLLRTKLHIPRSRPGLVPRPRLIERLNQGMDGELTLVSAPAGFGKTTLLAEWLATAEAGKGPAAWVALDQTDNEPTLFWAYFIEGYVRIFVDEGVAMRDPLRHAVAKGIGGAYARRLLSASEQRLSPLPPRPDSA